MFQNEAQREEHLERATPLPVQPASLDAERTAQAHAHRAGDPAGGAVRGRLERLGFLVSARQRSPRNCSRHSKHPQKRDYGCGKPRARRRLPRGNRKPAKSPAPAAAEVPFSAATERAALPPLQVEVVAGNRHINVPAKSNAIHLDVNSGETSTASSAPAPVNAPANAGNRVQLSPQTAQSVSVSVPPDYPLLARQMKVQGAVSLQALISRDGTIQELQILSGPSILATAAREAVKQWHFKPYLQNGQPVETQARITVNFTISTN